MLNTGVITALQLPFFVTMFWLSGTLTPALSASRCVSSPAFVGLDMVIGQSRDYCWFPLKRKKKQPCGSATERHGVIQREALGTETHPVLSVVGGLWFGAGRRSLQ